jgi:glycosyltransferase involved in cell wall biosynthesis
MSTHKNYYYSKINKDWDFNIYENNYTIGGLFKCSNLSGGYHGILKQYWEYYNQGNDVLLISENNKVKEEFNSIYPNWKITTIDFYPEISSMANNVDICGNICGELNPLINKYDLIINQATLEHVYNPFKAMSNLIDSLKPNGIIVTHTHPPAQEYHQYPKDYFRFMIDWWVDLPNYINNIELLEIYMHNNAHVFSCYRKNKVGWLINDRLAAYPNITTFWHNLLEWFPYLEDKTNGYTNFSILPSTIENEFTLSNNRPYYIIRNGTYFRSLNIDSKTVTLIQDIKTDDLFNQQIQTINESDVVIFNSNYVYNKYSSFMKHDRYKIIPLGINFDLFKPSQNKYPGVLPNSILYIGDSSIYPKGFDIVLKIQEQMPNQNFCFIMKDNYTINHPRIKVFNKISQNDVSDIINSCICTICTSREETQHLSGIQSGACNVPIVATAVGVYDDIKNSREWGLIADESNFIEKINYVINNIGDFNPRKFFLDNGYSIDACRESWKIVIENL